MQNIVLSSLQMALNRYLKLDPASNRRIHALNGKCVTICLKPIDLKFQLSFTDHHVELLQGEDKQSHIKISGTPLQLVALAVTPKDRHKFFAEDVEIEGNVVIANEVIHLFDQLEIDWEEVLAQRIGDIPSHYFSTLIKNFKSFSNHVNESMSQNIKEYLHEEKNLLPSQHELNQFYHAVDNARMDIDRLETRMKILQSQINEEIK